MLQPGSPVLAQLAARFGGDILSGEGVLDRRLLADRAFATPEGKADLDAITHPAIVRRIEAARQAAQAAGSPLFVIDGAVLVGSVIDGIWDRLIVVTAPYEVSVARIVARDGIRPEMARRRLDAQLPEAALAARADFLLANDGTQEQLRRQAGALAARLLAEGERGDRLPGLKLHTKILSLVLAAALLLCMPTAPAPDRRTALPLPLRRRGGKLRGGVRDGPAADLYLCAHRKQL